MGQPVANAVFAALSTDVVVFTLQDECLQVLLVRRRSEPYSGAWALPGGLVAADEGLDECASRMLGEKAGMRGVYLEQLYSFGTPERDPRGRVVSVAYYALAPWSRVQMDAMEEDTARGWVPVDDLPQLAFDHAAIVAMAHRRLKAKLAYSTIALQFMPEKFTLSELQLVYETILGESLDKRNFRKRVLAFSCIEETGECFRAGKHRPAKLFRVKTPGTVHIIK